MSYIHLTIEKRSQIEVLRKKDTLFVESLTIGVHHSTVAKRI